MLQSFFYSSIFLKQTQCFTEVSNGARQGKPEKLTGKTTDIKKHDNENGEPDEE